MEYSVKDNLLCLGGKVVPFKASPNHSGPMRKITTLIMHYTVTGTTEAAVRTLCDRRRQASAHIVLGRDAGVVQLVPFNLRAWHAGRSHYGWRSNFNNFSIGIEMVNWGWLHEKPDGRYISDGAGASVSSNDVIKAVHADGKGGCIPWQTYTPEQYEAACDIAAAICDAYGIKEILGHEDVSGYRGKRDPGPAFNVRRFAERVLGRK